MESTLKFLAPVFMLFVVIALVAGLWNMMKGGSANTSQNLMRLRVILQAIALVVLMALLWFSGHGPGSY